MIGTLARRTTLALHVRCIQRNAISRNRSLAMAREGLHELHEAGYGVSLSEIISTNYRFDPCVYPLCRDVWAIYLPGEMGALREKMCKQRAVWKAGAASPAIWT